MTTVTFTSEWFTDIHLKLGNVYLHSNGYHRFSDEIGRIRRILQNTIEPQSITMSSEFWDFVISNQE